MRVLLIEPNADTFRFFDTCLAKAEKLAWHIIQANTLSAGQACIAEGKLDIIFVSLSSSENENEGLQMVSQIHKQNTSLPILIIVESHNESLALRALHRGAIGYILADVVTCSELIRTIRTAIEQQSIQNKHQSYLHYIHQSHARLYNIINKSGDGMIIVNDHGVILFINPAASRLLNRSSSALLGSELGFPLVAGERAEIDVLCGVGRFTIAEIQVQEIDWEGETAYLATLRDITARKRSEQALQESEQRYKLLLSSVTDYIYTVFIDLTTGRPIKTTHSPNCVAVTGYTADEYDHDPYLWYRMVYEQDRLAVTHRASRVLAGKRVDPLEHRIIHKDGSLLWVKNTYVLRYDDMGHLIAYDGLISNITERKKAEDQVYRLNVELEKRVIKRTEQLEAMNKELANEIAERLRIEQQLRKLNRAVEQSPATIVITDTNGNIEYVNPKFTQTTGYTYEEALGKNPRILKSGQFPVEKYQELWDSIKTGNEWRGEFHNRRKNGELYWEFASISPIVNNAGEITHFLAVKEDITERKKAEEALMEARHIAESATRTKSEFLANMSHEIRTPLNAMIGMTILLSNSALSVEQQDYVETIRICGDALLDIINDILDFSKIEAGKLELHPYPMLLNDCLEESLGVVSTKVAEKGLELAYLIDPQVPVLIMGDAMRLRQILVNLLSNAVKFTEHGEVVVHVSMGKIAPETAPDTLSSPSLLTYHIQVRDTGIGISEEHIGRLFASFSQVHQSMSSRYGGTGLGLSISRRLAEMMGGTMWVESTLGKGSTFHFTIQTEPLDNQPQQQYFSLQPELMNKKLLIIDDHPTTCAMLNQWACSWGMVVYATTNPNEALNWILQGTMIDIAILDMTMRGMQDLSLANDVRSCPGCQTLPLILTTPVGISRSFVQESGLMGLFFLLKPVKMARLCDMLVHILTNKHFHFDEPNLLPQMAHTSQIIPVQHHSSHLRLLVAEDDPFNQKVIRLLLERIGYQPDIVGNGREVLHKLEHTHYDVILMDVLMPELDGFETTQLIRQQLSDDEQPYIIAMTAYALTGDKEQCLAVGMNGYVSKPVRIDELVHALEQARPRETPTTRTGGTSPKNHDQRQAPGSSQQIAPSPVAPLAPEYASTNQPPIDRTVIMNFFTSFGDRSTKMMHEIIQLFFDEVPIQIAHLYEALGQQNSALIHRIAHTLKSSSAQLGAGQLSQLFLHLEMMGKQANLEGGEILLQQIAQEYQRVEDALHRLLAEHG